MENNRDIRPNCHTKGQRKDQDKPLDEDDLTDEAREGLVFTFKASPGWLKNFMKRQDIATLKLKGEKADADFEAVDTWIVKWITEWDKYYLNRHPKTFRQAIQLVVNFDEAGIQYKSLPQYSLIKRGEEIRAKKPIKARISALFGAAANGHR